MEENSALVIAFRRPKQLAACLNSLIAAGVSRTYVSVDGPRPGMADDAAQIAKVVEVVESRSDQLNISLRQAQTNGGVGQGLVDGISWFFSHEPRGMVIEEDILIEPSSYRLATSMLRNLEDDSQIGSISLFNAVPRRKIRDASASWRLSALPSSWYWGTWANRWEALEPSISNWQQDFGTDGLHRIGGSRFFEFWSGEFERELAVGLVPWETLWLYTHWRKGWLSANTNLNHCINLGYTGAATNSFERPTWYPTQTTSWTGGIDFPSTNTRDLKADAWMANQMYGLSRSKVLKRNLGRKFPWLRQAWRNAKMEPIKFHGSVD
jgi:hypothetical protein